MNVMVYLFLILPCKKINVCWNNVYRKVFKMKMWESVKCLQFFCSRLDFVHNVLDHKLKFQNGFV